jgi:predicted membrane channel-forming protein YqfA (hemolysin III family)
VAKTEEYLWVIPALLIVISVLSSISIAGVVLAWKDRSGVRLQRTMSYIVLPLLIMTSIACWMVVVVTSFSSMIGTGEYSNCCCAFLI